MAVNYEALFDLTGRVGIVTGGAGTLGREIVPGLLANGATVVVADRDAKAASEMAESLRSAHGSRVMPIHCDVADEDSVKALVNETVTTYGEINFLLNNAATAAVDPLVYHAPFEEYELAEWRRVMAVNLEGVFLVAKTVGAQMVRQGKGGAVVQTSSIYGVLASDNRIYEGSTYKGQPMNNPPPYAASKAGVIGLTRWLATYWAEHNIRVNAVAPGGVEAFENENFSKKYSARIPLGRMARAHEVVGAMIYLVSDASSYVTGQCLMVDGGLSAW